MGEILDKQWGTTYSGASARDGKGNFNAHYARVYGARWPHLLSALLKSEKKLDYVPFQKHTDAHGLVYGIDKASLIPVQALQVEPGHRVLDMCAAPGGKTLRLWEMLTQQGPSFANQGSQLFANELSLDRRKRLIRVIHEYIPESLQTGLQVTGHDASIWGLKESQAYDRVLLDAPCSGERHLMQNPGELKSWSPARSRNLSIRQYALLASGWMALKTGGLLVYSTCSISPAENDAIIDKLISRKGAEVDVLKFQGDLGEPTTNGWQIMPDICDGWGPIYFAVIRKIASN